MLALLIAAVAAIAAAAFLAWLSTILPDDQPCHREPLRPYTVAEAHEVMQDLRRCQARWCAAKNAAYWTLADAGELEPDRSVERTGR